MTGDSTLFAETTQDWRQSRKAISPAFYRGKLEQLIEIAKQAMRTTLERFQTIRREGEGPRAEIDIQEEIGMMVSRILLVCALGIDCADELVDFWEGGRLTKKLLAYSLRATFTNLLDRISSLHLVFFPFLATYHLTPFERDQQRNARALRAFCYDLVDKRRAAIAREVFEYFDGDLRWQFMTAKSPGVVPVMTNPGP